MSQCADGYSRWRDVTDGRVTTSSPARLQAPQGLSPHRVPSPVCGRFRVPCVIFLRVLWRVAWSTLKKGLKGSGGCCSWTLVSGVLSPKRKGQLVTMPGPRRVAMPVFIVLSLMWMTGGIAYSLKSQSDEFARVTRVEQADCLHSTGKTTACNAQAARELGSVDYRKRWIAAGAQTAIPLAVVWVIAFLALGVARWIFADHNRS
jgi:hypothetical protein